MKKDNFIKSFNPYILIIYVYCISWQWLGTCVMISVLHFLQKIIFVDLLQI